MNFPYKNKFLLIKTFAIAEIKSKDQDTFIGFLWMLLYPLIMSLIMYFVFSGWAKKHIDSFALYLLVGIISWNYFTSATTSTVDTFLKKASYVKNFKFPYEFLVAASTASHFFAYVILMTALTFFTFAAEGALSPSAFLLPFFIISYLLFVMGTSLILATLYLFITDVEYLWSIVVKISIFITPVFYSTQMISERYRGLMLLNPFYYNLGVLRSIMVYKQFPSYFHIAASLFINTGIFIFGYKMFKKLSIRFVELM